MPKGPGGLGQKNIMEPMGYREGPICGMPRLQAIARRVVFAGNNPLMRVPMFQPEM
jgi:hypothetical protein